MPPNPHAAGSSTMSKWWVLDIHSRGFSGLKAVMETAKPPTNPFSSVAAGPFTSQAAADKWISANQPHGSLPSLPNVGGWLSGLGGFIGSGIEAGFVSFFKDLWTVLVGPLEILLGVLIALWVLVIYFKDDIMQLARMAGTMAVMAG